jgi:6-phosphogluconolactonase
MSEGPALTVFDHADAARDALVETTADALADGIERAGEAALVVSGGRSPIPYFQALARQPLVWRRVTVTLADERWVPPSDQESNERLVREMLLTGGAADADFVGLYTGAETPEAGASAAARALDAVPRPFDLVVLGIGEDGHTASFFPGAPALDQALAGSERCVAVRSTAVPQPRITLSLSTLLDSRRIVLAIAGEAKRRVYEQALSDGPVGELPVRAVLRQTRTPVDVYWSP